MQQNITKCNDSLSIQEGFKSQHGGDEDAAINSEHLPSQITLSHTEFYGPQYYPLISLMQVCSLCILFPSSQLMYIFRSSPAAMLAFQFLVDFQQNLTKAALFFNQSQQIISLIMIIDVS